MINHTLYFDWDIFYVLKRIQNIWCCFNTFPDDIIYYIMNILANTVHPNNICICTNEKCQLSWNKVLGPALYEDLGYNHCMECHKEIIIQKGPICNICKMHGCYYCRRIYHNKKYICNTCWPIFTPNNCN